MCIRDSVQSAPCRGDDVFRDRFARLDVGVAHAGYGGEPEGLPAPVPRALPVIFHSLMSSVEVALKDSFLYQHGLAGRSPFVVEVIRAPERGYGRVVGG